MPELPDVEGYREVLVRCAQGRRITRVEVTDPGVLHGLGPRQLERELTGRRFTAPARHGKWLLARTDGPTVLLHFGMTGQLLCCRRDESRAPHDRVVFTVDGRELRYRDQRKLHGLWLGDDARVARLLAGQGPDALTVGAGEFSGLLARRSARVKAVLIDQSTVAGLGNLLADEILWRAGLHPALPAAALTAGQRRRLYRQMRTVLRTAVRAGGVPGRCSWLTGRRADAEPRCPRCGSTLEWGRIAGRTTAWCPRCQPER